MKFRTCIRCELHTQGVVVLFRHQNKETNIAGKERLHSTGAIRHVLHGHQLMHDSYVPSVVVRNLHIKPSEACSCPYGSHLSGLDDTSELLSKLSLVPFLNLRFNVFGKELSPAHPLLFLVRLHTSPHLSLVSLKALLLYHTSPIWQRFLQFLPNSLNLKVVPAVLSLHLNFIRFRILIFIFSLFSFSFRRFHVCCAGRIVFPVMQRSLWQGVRAYLYSCHPSTVWRCLGSRKQ